MNQLVIEKDGELLVLSSLLISKFNIPKNEEIDLPVYSNEYIGFIELLETASRLSFIEPEILDRNLKLIEIAGKMCTNKEKHFMLASIRQSIMKNFLDVVPSEFDVHKWFKSRYRTLLGKNFKMINRKNDPKHIPDFWLSFNNKFIPVEIKLNSFDNRHLKQLQRYMFFYKCSEGIAVAQSLNCELPKNIKFISYNIQEVIK